MKYGKQNFDNGTVEVYVNGEIFVCNMYQDNDGDFLFYYENEPYWFKDCKRV